MFLSFQSYTILVKTRPGLDNCPAIIERRYSDFLQLFRSMHRTYPSLLHDLTFPKKAVLGNFTADIITERSTSFHSFLTYLNSHKELRQARQFYDFLHYKEVCSHSTASNCNRYYLASICQFLSIVGNPILMK